MSPIQFTVKNVVSETLRVTATPWDLAMKTSLNSLDRRRFLRGAGIALTLPWMECSAELAKATGQTPQRKRFACFYQPDGVPMPLPEDPAYKEWAWFPHGNGADFQFTQSLMPLEQFRQDVTVLSGFSHPSARRIHGHSNADQFLTAAPTGPAGPYQNTISLDQELAAYLGDQTRVSSLVLSTDGGTGTPRGAHTLSFSRSGRAIPAEHRPKRIFDMLFVKSDDDAARRLELSQSALDDLLEDANSLRRSLSSRDQQTLDEYLQSVRDTEIKVEKAKRWLNFPLPDVNVDHLKLDITMDDPRQYLRTMFELIYLAFKTDSTRIVTYQLGRENGIGVSDYLARAIGFNLTHQLSHETKEPGGWKNFGLYCQFLMDEYARFMGRLKETPEPGADGNMLDNTLLLFGSASSAFHLSRNYPLVLSGGKNLGFRHGRYLNHAGLNFQGGAWDGGQEPWQKDENREDLPLSNLFVTILRQMGVETESFADSTGQADEVLT